VTLPACGSSVSLREFSLFFLFVSVISVVEVTLSVYLHQGYTRGFMLKTSARHELDSTKVEIHWRMLAARSNYLEDARVLVRPPRRLITRPEIGIGVLARGDAEGVTGRLGSRGAGVELRRSRDLSCLV
jgi:hypothetical protein